MRGESGENKSRLGRGSAEVVHQQPATMAARVAMDKRSDIVILRQEDAICPDRLRQKGFISWIGRKFRGIKNIVAAVAHSAHGPRHDVGIRQDAHAIRRRP